MQVTVTVPEEIGRAAEELAEERGSSVSALYAEAVEQYITELRRQRAIERISRIIQDAEVVPGTAELIDQWRREDDHRTL